ncbi:MAG: hypothetical protein WCC28_23315 [Mycobacterium sp.]
MPDLWTDLFTSAVTPHTVCHQSFRTEDGTLVASYAQEALLRFRDGAGR